MSTSNAAEPSTWPFPTNWRWPTPGWLDEDVTENPKIDLDGGLSAVNEIEPVSATQQARDLGVHFCHVIEEQPAASPLNGVSIAYRRVSNWPNSRMVEVAVVYCSRHDTFNKKTGTRLAAERFLANNTIIIPVARSQTETIRTLKQVFWEWLAYRK